MWGGSNRITKRKAHQRCHANGLSGKCLNQAISETEKVYVK